MTRRSKVAATAALFIFLSCLAWLFPVAAFYLLRYPYYAFYYLPFRERSVTLELPVRWETLPPGTAQGISPSAKPVFLRFVANPNMGFIVDANEVEELRYGNSGTSTISVHVRGDRGKGYHAVQLLKVGRLPFYGAGTSTRMCPGSCPDGFGIDPLDTAICGGICRDK